MIKYSPSSFFFFLCFKPRTRIKVFQNEKTLFSFILSFLQLRGNEERFLYMYLYKIIPCAALLGFCFFSTFFLWKYSLFASLKEAGF